MHLSDFDFELPAELIAQQPPDVRGGSRLLTLDRSTGAIAHRRFFDLPTLLSPGDLLVVNDTRVFPARLLGRRLPGGGAAECLLVASTDEPDTWSALVHPGQRLKPGSRIDFGPLQAEVVGRHFHGRRTVKLWTTDGRSVGEVVDEIGHVPLPPYIARPDERMDRERYQTIYARARGSIAAPTAGLHFTPALFEALAARGVECASITLHVGYGTFQPIRTETVEAHQMEPEAYEVTSAAATAISRARREKRRVIAVGTTTTRTLESLAFDRRGDIVPGRGRTGLFIRPGHDFQVVNGLITNFHLPKSSLLLLVSALAGREAVLAAYGAAVTEGYRFYSYGDAMLVLDGVK